MSLRWIQENQEAPICDEECSDIGDSSDDDESDDLTENLNLNPDEDIKPDDDDGNNSGNGEHRRQKRETFRHPTTTVTLKSIREKALSQGYDPNVSTGNPTFGPVMQLHSMTGYRLSILPCGKVRGLDCECNPYAILKVSTVANAVVQIQGIETGLYLAMNGRGRLYGDTNKDKENTKWQHLIVGSYSSYRSIKFADREWYVGIKMNGRPKNGRKTGINQKATKFLSVRK